MNCPCYQSAGFGILSWRAAACISVLLLWAIASWAQQEQVPTPEQASQATSEHSGETSDPKVESIFPHFKAGRFWISGQSNFIFQTHPDFPAKYTGQNSLLPHYEKATSRVLTLFTGVKLDKSTEVLVDIEETGGAGLSQSLGVAGFPNLDVVRNPQISKAPYLARVIVDKVISFSPEKIENDRGPLSLFDELPARREKSGQPRE